MSAQNITYAKKVVEILSSDSFEGRGYNNSSNGLKKSSTFINNEFEKLGYSANYQFFNHSIIIHDSASLIVGEKMYLPGKVFLPEVYRGYTLSLDGLTFELDSLDLDKIKNYRFRIKKKYRKTNLIGIAKESDLIKVFGKGYFGEIAILSKYNFKGIIVKKKKLTWTVWSKKPMVSFTQIQILDNINIGNLEKISYQHQTHLADVRNKNIIATTDITTENDSEIIICGHYDHLGMIGKIAIFNGANDNASGIGMLLDLARGYKEGEWSSRYKIKFIAFGAEEAGLLGSDYFANELTNPKIKYVINLDLMGNAEDGVMIVNALDNKELVDRFKRINETTQLVPKIGERANSPNSDHYPFTQQNPKIAAVFLYVMGAYPHYHDVNDRYENLPFTNFENVYKLITKVIESL